VSEAADRSAIQRLFERGKQAWPTIDVALPRLAAFVGAHAEGEAAIDALHADDVYLACACADAQPAALAAFEARFLSEVPLFLRGVDRSEATIEEVKQLVRERLFVASPDRRPKIAEYSGRGALGSWLRVVTLRVAANRRRTDKNHAPLDEERDAPAMLTAIDPDLALVRTKYKREFADALRAAFGGLSAREGLLDRTMALLGERLKLSTHELESLLKVVRSTLDVSLRGLLLGEG